MTEERVNAILAEASALMTSEPISTSRLFLRPFIDSDFEDFCEYITQRELQRLSGNPAISTREQARESFDWILERNLALTTRFAAVLKENGRVVGNFCVDVYPFIRADERLADKKGLSVSLVLNEKYQRRGLMTELLQRVIRYFLAEHGFDFINSGYFDYNEGSRKIQQRAGMRHYMDHTFEYEGNIIPVHEMIIYRGDIE